MKIIFITGGAISGLGKGVTTSSIGKLFQSSGYSVGMVKMDPYLQVDAGTMSPYEHGEVFVTEDGAECDLDIGNYERFVGAPLGRENNITTGKVYQNVIAGERRGDYLGKTVQMYPHISDEINRLILLTASKHDITLVEVGGTIGDIENAPFLEAIRSLKHQLGESNIACGIVAPILELSYSGEVKTKLVQNSVKELRKTGVIPDFIICRSETSLPDEIKNKIALTCDVKKEGIIEAINAKSIYLVPEIFKQQDLHTLITTKLELSEKECDLQNWNALVANITDSKTSITIGIVGKYTQFEDTYKSIGESLIHAGAYHKTRIIIKWIDSEALETSTPEQQSESFSEVSGILIPGGFGKRGVEGMILSAEYARKNNIPYLGICLGMQVAVIEYAQNVCGLSDAHSSEFDTNTQQCVIDIMAEQKDITQKGATMRLGNYKAHLRVGSLAESLYQTNIISERHRHRYEVNPEYHNILEENGLILSGKSPDNTLVEFVEIADHPFYIATQAHPEFKSSLESPHPLFVGFVGSSIKNTSQH